MHIASSPPSGDRPSLLAASRARQLATRTARLARGCEELMPAENPLAPDKGMFNNTIAAAALNKKQDE